MSEAAAPEMIVVIDDDYAMRLSCSKILSKMGLRVEAFENGARGLEGVAELKPGLVVVDLKMPGISGLEVISRVHEIDPQIIMVVITGYATIDTAVEAMKSGAYDFLPKPFSPDELRMIINRGLDRRRLALESQRGEVERALLKRRFVTFVSHQLRTPLVAIHQYLDVLKHLDQTKDDPARRQEWIDRCLKRTEELQNLITDWLTLARVEGGTLVKERVEVDLKPIISGILASYEEMAAAEQVSLEAVWPEEALCVCGRPELPECSVRQPDHQCHQVQQARRQGHGYRLPLRRRGGDCRRRHGRWYPGTVPAVSVRRVLPHQGGRRQKDGGHGPGTAYFEENRFGNGWEYRGREPGRNRLDFSGALAGMARTGGRHGNGELGMTMEEKRILIVDDDRDFVEAVACFLEANRFTVFQAHDGKEGVKLAKLERPDLILMDIMMNERTEGFFTIQEMRRDAELKGVPIFVISSFCTHLPDFEIPESGGWLAHDMFFSKPVDLVQLLEKIRQRLGKAA